MTVTGLTVEDLLVDIYEMNVEDEMSDEDILDELSSRGVTPLDLVAALRELATDFEYEYVGD